MGNVRGINRSSMFAIADQNSGTKLESRIDIMPWYAGKLEVSRYLEDLNKDKKVIGSSMPRHGLTDAR